MALPLRLKGPETSGPNSNNPTINAGVSVYALQEMSTNEVLDGVGYRLLREFAKINAVVPRTGDLTLRDTVGDTPTISTGDYVDTTRVLGVGDRGTFNTLSQIDARAVTIYQVLTPVTGQIVRPLCYRDLALREMTDQEIIDNILSPIMDRMTNYGIGSYTFSQTVPRHSTTGADLPGIWSSVFSVNDRYKSGTVPSTSVVGFVAGAGASTRTYNVQPQNVNQIDTYTLWRKIDDDSPPAFQPRLLKWANTADRGKHVVEMSSADILTLLIPFRNLIVTDGRGRYKFQNDAPVGTWGRRGDKIRDLLNAVTETYFQSATINSSTGFFTRTVNFTGQRNTSSTGTFTGFYIRYYNDKRWGFISDDSQRSFTGFYSRNFAGTAPTFRTGTTPVAKFFANITINSYQTGVIDNVVFEQGNDYLWVKRAN